MGTTAHAIYADLLKYTLKSFTGLAFLGLIQTVLSCQPKVTVTKYRIYNW